MKNNNSVTQPAHYTQYEREVIDSIRGLCTKEEYSGYCKGNIIKYLARYKQKGGCEDLRKAKRYLEYLDAHMSGDRLADIGKEIKAVHK